jgi:hypothetical protein
MEVILKETNAAEKYCNRLDLACLGSAWRG